MSWEGYLTYDGVEIVNVARTEAYALAGGAGEWFTPTYNNPYLRELLDQPEYTTPALDSAPWYDQDIPVSNQFWGLYPLDVSGMDDSTRSAETIEFSGPGGVPGRLRSGTGAPVWQVMLMGADDKACEYGFQWLKRATLGRVCAPLRGDATPLGFQVGFLSTEPELPVTIPGGVPVDGDTVFLYGGDAGGIPADTVAGPDARLREYMRFFNNAKVTRGPVVERKRTTSACNGAIWIVQFTLTTGDPHQYGRPLTMLQGYLDPSVTDPWPADVPEPGIADSTWHSWTEVDCGQEIWQPIFDPTCTAMITPPPPPSIPLGCYDPPATWQRRKVSIPAGNIPLWGDMVPVLTVYSEMGLRNLRVRWYANPDGDFDPDDNPCDFVGDWVVSYIPPGGTMVVDSVDQAVRVTTELGYTRRADSLVFQNDSTPIVWPQLSCGFGYIMTLDLPAGQPVPVVDLAFVAKAAA